VILWLFLKSIRFVFYFYFCYKKIKHIMKRCILILYMIDIGLVSVDEWNKWKWNEWSSNYCFYLFYSLMLCFVFYFVILINMFYLFFNLVFFSL
jgi:hypothetical protein